MTRGEREPDETFRCNCCCAACFAGHDRIRFRQAGHGALARGGRRPDPGQGRPRSRPRTHGPGRARSPLRVGQRPWSSLRMVQRPRSPPSPISIRWIRFRHSIARAIRELQRRERVAPTRRGRFSLPNTVRSECRWRSAEPHLDRDPDQVGMILGAELLLEQRGGVGHRLVGNLQRIGDFDDLVTAAKQPQDF